MTFDAESLQRHIPYYLTAEDRHVLVSELNAIIAGGAVNYFLSSYHDSFKAEMLQGDGWRGFQLFLFDSGERHSVRGIVLSNSCDVDPANTREIPARVVFAPLVRLAAFRALLDANGIGADRVAAKIDAIRAQRTTNIFYLPAGGPLTEDYMIRFDEVHSMPLSAHVRSSDREKLFTLTNTGFYMLVLKLSLHFCRLQEGINRKESAATV